ncbi:MAG: hypothetical protein LBG18_04770 [Mediterranea sp.]|nr:hypothetical protein [Mediterranea sp.]
MHPAPGLSGPEPNPDGGLAARGIGSSPAVDPDDDDHSDCPTTQPEERLRTAEAISTQTLDELKIVEK